jgi:phage terminase large subunit-like protein
MADAALIDSLLETLGPQGLIDQLGVESFEDLKYAWRLWARPDQIVPDGDWRHALFIGGRGCGKTRCAAEFVRDRVEQGRARYIHLIGRSSADIRDTMIEHGPSSILKVSRPDFMPVYEPSKRRLTWPNGAVAVAFSAEEPGALRGPQCDLAWTDEVGAWKYQRDTWEMMEFGLRLRGPKGDPPQCLVTTTPSPTDVIIELMKGIKQADGSRVARDDVFQMPRASTRANAANLDPSFLRALLRRYEGTRIGRQELDAELLEDVEGALWTLAVISAARIGADVDPEHARRVVAIDPAASSTDESDETGIVVAGRRMADGDADVLADLSGRLQPHEWAKRAVDAYEEFDCDQIVAEKNNGGDMVKHTIRTVSRHVPIKLVWASRGKVTRAEPVASLYEQGRVHHVGSFPLLEDQLTTWVQGTKSPDRLDALVWAVTELMLTKRHKRRPAGAVAVDFH